MTPLVSRFQLIFSGEYTKAMNKDWHSGHFSCWQCDESLTGQRYVLRDDHPYCIKCYENVFANNCDECNRLIGIDSKVSSATRGRCLVLVGGAWFVPLVWEVGGTRLVQLVIVCGVVLLMVPGRALHRKSSNGRVTTQWT